VKSRILGLLHDARETIAHARLDTGMFCQVALGFIAPLISELGKLLGARKPGDQIVVLRNGFGVLPVSS